MKKIVFTILPILTLALPQLAFAQFVPCDGVGINGGIPCDACHFIEMGQRILTWLIVILAVVFGAVALMAGWGLVTSGGNPAALSAAKQKLLNALIGFLLVLAAWLIIDILMRSLLAGGTGSIAGYGPWNQIQCGSMADPDVVIPGYNSVDLATVNCADATCSTESADCTAMGGTPTVNPGPPPTLDCNGVSTGAAAGGACDQSTMTTVSFLGRSITVNNALVGPLASVESCVGGAASGYSIRSMGAYNCRSVTGGSGYSMHAYGAAIDINAAQNGYGPKQTPCPSDMPSAFVSCFTSNGFGWGGNWRSVCDAMHFSGASREGGSLLNI